MLSDKKKNTELESMKKKSTGRRDRNTRECPWKNVFYVLKLAGLRRRAVLCREKYHYYCLPRISKSSRPGERFLLKTTMKEAFEIIDF